MTSVGPIANDQDFTDESPAAEDHVDAAALDAQFAAVKNKINALLTATGLVIRDDDTLVDQIVRLRNLHPEILTAIAANDAWLPKVSVACASTGNLTLSGEQTIDGVLTSASRVLAKDQTAPAENGIYVSAAGAWARATDADTAAELGLAAVLVTGGTLNANSAWVQTIIASAITLGTTSLVWAQYAGQPGVTPTAKGGTGQTSIAAWPTYDRRQVRVAATSSTTISAPGATIDGVTMAAGDRVLLTAQGTGSQNGLWVWNGAAVPLTRPVDYAPASTVQAFQDVTVFVREGTANAGSRWRVSTSGAITIDTTAHTWSLVSDYARATGGTTARTLAAIAAERFNVKAFGAKGDGSTDDTAAIRAAGVALQAAGGGTLFFPRGTYQLYTDGSSATLCDFSGLTGVQIIGDAAVLNVNRTFSGTQTIQYVFHFTTCVDVFITGLRLTSPEETGSNKTTRGAYWFWFENACRNIVIPFLDVVGGVMVLGFFKLVGDADSMKSRNIHVGTIRTKSVGYPINCQFSGDDMVVQNLVTELAYRSFLIYGVKNVRAHITAKDTTASDVVITAFGGKGCEDVEIDYHNTDTTASIQSTTDCAVAIRFSDSTAAVIRNIRVHVNLIYPATGWFGNGVQIDKYASAGVVDVTDRGHLLENVVISGRANGPAISSGAFSLFTVGTWGTGETVRNITVRDFTSVGLGASYMTLTALTDRALLDNYYTDGNCYLSVSAAGRLVVSNSKAANFFPSSADASRIDFIGCEITSAASLARANKTFIETVIGSDRRSAHLPSIAIGGASPVIRCGNVKYGDMTTARDFFRVKSTSQGLMARLKVFAVYNSADFTAGTRKETIAIKTFTATQGPTGTWGAILAVADEVTQQNKNGATVVTVTLVNGDATGGKIQIDVSTYSHASGYLLAELEVFSLADDPVVTAL